MARATKYFVKDLDVKDAAAAELLVESLGENRYAVTLEGKTFEVDALQLPNGGLSLLAGTASWAADFEEKNDEMAVLVRGQRVRLDVADERKLRLRAANAAFGVEGKQTINAPMPGKVVKILVKTGDEVVEGQGLVVVEAMKMENELKSPKGGKVTEVLAKEGTAVENGAPLIVVE